MQDDYEVSIALMGADLDLQEIWERCTPGKIVSCPENEAFTFPNIKGTEAGKDTYGVSLWTARFAQVADAEKAAASLKHALAGKYVSVIGPTLHTYK